MRNGDAVVIEIETHEMASSRARVHISWWVAAAARAPCEAACAANACGDDDDDSSSPS